MDEIPDSADLVVVGGGVCGHACAASAAARGARVVLVEKEQGPAHEASGRAQGSLRLQGRHPAEFPLAQEAMKLWAAVAEESDDAEIVFGGNVYVCDDERELPMLRRVVDDAHRAGLADVRLLAPEQARALMPALKGPFVAAVHSPVDGGCDPASATRFLARRARDAGAKPHYGVTARRILTEGDAVSGVVTGHGTVGCAAVVVAGGIWTPYLTETAGVRVPIMPVALSEGETTPRPPLFSETIRAFGVGARPRPDGRIVFSAGLDTTVDHRITLYDLRHLRLWAPRLVRHWRDVRLSVDIAGAVRQVRAGSARSTDLIGPARHERPNLPAIHRALRVMQRLLPDLADTSLGRAWTGLVDMSPDGLPILDGAAGPDGLVVATGLSGHGFTLGPVIGEITADLALTGATVYPIRPFRLARFREEPVEIPEKMI